MAIAKDDITGVILAGGRGSRMGGVDKGLQPFRGAPLALHALMRLAPQVGAVMINANRNLSAYEALEVPVWPDSTPDFPGPLAGMLTGLEHCETPWLVSVPCDVPFFPLDLVQRLADAADAIQAPMATVRAPDEEGQMRIQPVFCLMRADLVESITQAMQSGERKIDRWMAQHPYATLEVDDARAFQNANTLADLYRITP